MKKMITDRSGLTTTVLLGVAAGVASPILLTNISRFLGIWGNDEFYLIALLVFFVLGLFLAYRIEGHVVLAEFIAIFSIALGVCVDVELDWFLRSYDRNLWPFEIVLWWVVSPVPMILGALIAKVVWRKRKTE